ncbi:uncharacterized protein L201_001951 [Kwoniella dendrophila CBS 6074]|uniref:Uncharacterized protein n=1 Tax=Kwoniella dendrophila CBS 6074 TaxID=1295534 RepID=A0AAX4JPR3_9TREE
MSSHRAYLSKAEVDKVDQLEKAYTSQDGVHNFACSGIFPLQAIESEKLALYYGKPQDGTADGMIKCVTFPLTDETAKDVYNVAQPSPFGRGTELVYDETYRQAHEIKPPYFALSSDILSSSGLLALLAKKLDYEIPLAGRVNKLNAYTEGGFLNPTKIPLKTKIISEHS